MVDEREDLILSDDGEFSLENNEREKTPANEQPLKFTGLESIAEEDDSFIAISDPSPGGAAAQPEESEELTFTDDIEPAPPTEAFVTEEVVAREIAEPEAVGSPSMEAAGAGGIAEPEAAGSPSMEAAGAGEIAEPEAAGSPSMEAQPSMETAGVEGIVANADERPEEPEGLMLSNDIDGEFEGWEDEEAADSEQESIETYKDDGVSLPDIEDSGSSQSYAASEQESVFNAAVEPRILFKAMQPQSDLIKNKKSYFWAIDVGSHTIKVVGLKEKRKGPELVFLSLVEILPGYSLPQQEKSYQHAIINALNVAINGIKKWQKGAGFVSSIGSNAAVVRQVQYPVAVKDKLLSAIQWEVRKFIPYEPEEVVVDAQILESGEKKMDVLLAAVPKENLRQHQTILSGGGLTSKTVDADSIALTNAMMTQINLQPQETVLMIDVGAKTTLLNMFQKGGLFFSRSLSIAGDRFTQVISSELRKGFSEAEAIKRGESGGGNGYNPERIADLLIPSYKQLYSEIQKSIMFYNKQTDVKDFHYLFLSGGGANLPGLREFLSDKLGKEIALLSPVAGLLVDEKNITKEILVRFGPQLALAIGLAYRTRVE